MLSPENLFRFESSQPKNIPWHPKRMPRPVFRDNTYPINAQGMVKKPIRRSSDSVIQEVLPALCHGLPRKNPVTGFHHVAQL